MDLKFAFIFFDFFLPFCKLFYIVLKPWLSKLARYNNFNFWYQNVVLDLRVNRWHIPHIYLNNTVNFIVNIYSNSSSYAIYPRFRRFAPCFIYCYYFKRFFPLSHQETIKITLYLILIPMWCSDQFPVTCLSCVLNRK